MPLGKWKASPKRRDQFLKRALGTNAPIGRIARRAGMSPIKVSEFSVARNIRSPEEIERLGRASTKKTKAARRPKKNFFSRQEKLAALDNYDRKIRSVAGSYFRKNPLLRRKFRDISELVDEIKEYLFEQLDYYDPDFETEKGKTSVYTWIMNGSMIFCRIEGKNPKIGEFTLGEKDSGLLGSIRPEAPLRGYEVALRRRQIPMPARSFLKSLGFDIDSVAVHDFGEIRQTLLEIAKNPETGLDSVEKAIVKARLSGAPIKSLGEMLPLLRGMKAATGERARQLEKPAIRKMREAIGRMSGERR